jgi:Uma2 family endonuclease
MAITKGATRTMRPREIDYPETDGKPMAETDWHWVAMVDLTQTLRERYRDDPDVYVACHMFLYYREGDPRAVVAPDVFVVFGVPKRMRRTYKLWEEGVAPAVAIEVTSRKTRKEDLQKKRAIYAQLGVREYFLFDPEAAYLKPPLQGLRLVAGDYEPIPVAPGGTVRSDVLGLDLRSEPAGLVVTDVATGKRLLAPAERAQLEEDRAEEARRRAEQAEAEAERLRAENERLRAGEGGE